MNAIWRQDWSTVFLEIMIVVVGIFIGLQVDGWNEDRKHRNQEKIYFTRIADDLLAMKRELENLIAMRQMFVNQMAAATLALESCDDSSESQAAISFALLTYQVAPGFKYFGATYEEMLATGAFARIGNLDLKKAIANTFSGLTRFGRFLESIRASLPVVDEILWRYADYGIEPGTAGSRVSFDLQTLCRNREVRNAFVEIVDIQRDGMGVGKPLLDDIVALLSQLEIEAARL